MSDVERRSGSRQRGGSQAGCAQGQSRFSPSSRSSKSVVKQKVSSSTAVSGDQPGSSPLEETVRAVVNRSRSSFSPRDPL